MNCVSCDICVYHLGLCVLFPGVFLSSRVTGACPVTTDLIMRVNVRTTTTTIINIVYKRVCALVFTSPRPRFHKLYERFGLAHVFEPMSHLFGI